MVPLRTPPLPATLHLSHSNHLLYYKERGVMEIRSPTSTDFRKDVAYNPNRKIEKDFIFFLLPFCTTKFTRLNCTSQFLSFFKK